MIETLTGRWRKLIPAEPRAIRHACRPPSDPEVQHTVAKGSEWVCGECGRIWEARKVGPHYGVSLYPTKEFDG